MRGEGWLRRGEEWVRMGEGGLRECPAVKTIYKGIIKSGKTAHNKMFRCTTPGASGSMFIIFYEQSFRIVKHFRHLVPIRTTVNSS